MRPRMIGQHLLHRGDELARNRIKHPSHDIAFAFTRVTGLTRDQLSVMAPALAITQLHPGARERIKDILDRRRRVLACHDRAQAREALFSDGVDDLAEYRVVKAILGAKMITDQSELNTRRRCDLAHGNTIVASLGEQSLRRI